MKWLRIPLFLWLVVIKYYANRLMGMRTSVITSNWVYFLRVALPSGVTIKRVGSLYQVYNPEIGHTVMLRPGSSDVLVYLQIFFNHEYALLNDLQLPGKPVVVDLGANAGFFMLLAKVHWYAATVLCVEPDSKNFALIGQQVEANQLPDVHIIRAGVWIANEALKVTSEPKGLEWAFGVRADPSGDTPGLTFTKILNDHRISHVDLLKIDIEGTEEILFEDNAFLEKLERSVSNIIMETHHVEKQKIIASILRARNFEVKFDRELIFANRNSK